MDKRDVLEKLFRYIDDRDEWVPGDTGWKAGRVTDVGRVRYRVTDRMIQAFRSALNGIDVVERGSKHDWVKIYKISDSSRTRLGVAEDSVKRALARQLMRHMKKDSSVFDDFVQIEGLTAELIACVKKDQDIKKCVKSLEKKHGVRRSVSEPFVHEYQRVLNTVQPDIEKRTATVFRLKNRTNGRCYIGGSKTEIDRKQVVRSLAMSVPEIKKDIKSLKHSFSFKILKKIDYGTDLELKIALDAEAERWNSVEDGYNSRMRYVKSRMDPDKLFLDANREFAVETVSDSYEYDGTDGFIYVVRNMINGKRFVGAGKGTLVDSINAVYSGKPSKSLYEDLKKYPFSDFEFEIVKFKRDKHTDLGVEVGRLIERYKTDDRGYN